MVNVSEGELPYAGSNPELGRLHCFEKGMNPTILPLDMGKIVETNWNL